MKTFSIEWRRKQMPTALHRIDCSLIFSPELMAEPCFQTNPRRHTPHRPLWWRDVLSILGIGVFSFLHRSDYRLYAVGIKKKDGNSKQEGRKKKAAHNSPHLLALPFSSPCHWRSIGIRNSSGLIRRVYELSSQSRAFNELRISLPFGLSFG